MFQDDFPIPFAKRRQLSSLVAIAVHIQDHHLTREFDNRPDKSNNIPYLLTFQIPFAPYFSILTHLTTAASLLGGSAATIVEYAPGDPWWHCHPLEGWSPVEVGRDSFVQICSDYDVNYNICNTYVIVNILDQPEDSSTQLPFTVLGCVIAIVCLLY